MLGPALLICIHRLEVATSMLAPRKALGIKGSSLKFICTCSQDLADGVAVGMDQLDAPRLVDVLVALADLGMFPGDAWLRLHERHCDAVMANPGSADSFTGYQVRLLVQATEIMARLRAQERAAATQSLGRGIDADGVWVSG